MKSEIFEDPLQNVRLQFWELGGVLHELVEPIDDKSPVQSLIRRNIRFYHTCFEVDKIEMKIVQLEQEGFHLISPPKKAVAFDGREVAFVMSKEGDLIELLDSRQ